MEDLIAHWYGVLVASCNALRKHFFRNKITLREKVSDFLLPVPWVSASILNDHFHASNVQEKRRWASETETVICLVTTLPGPGLGRNGNLANVAKRIVSVFSKQCLLHVPCLGAGHGWRWGLWGGEWRLAGKPGSLWTGLGGGGGGRWSDLDIIPCARHPRVRGGVKVRASIALTRGMRCGAVMQLTGERSWNGSLQKWVVNNLLCAQTSVIVFQIVTHLNVDLCLRCRADTVTWKT